MCKWDGMEFVLAADAQNAHHCKYCRVLLNLYCWVLQAIAQA